MDLNVIKNLFHCALMVVRIYEEQSYLQIMGDWGLVVPHKVVRFRHRFFFFFSHITLGMRISKTAASLYLLLLLLNGRTNNWIYNLSFKYLEDVWLPVRSLTFLLTTKQRQLQLYLNTYLQKVLLLW